MEIAALVGDMIAWLQGLPDRPWFWLILSAAAGSALLYVIARSREETPFSVFQAFNIIRRGRMDEARPIIIILDMIVSSLVGGSIIYLTRPESVREAFTSGLGLTGVIAALAPRG